MRPRGHYRAIFTALLEDPHFLRLSSSARLLLLTLRLSEEAGPGCIWRFYREPFAVRTGLQDGAFETAFEELRTNPSAHRPWIFFDAQDGVLWIRNGLRWDPSLNLADLKHRRAVETVLSGLPPSPLIRQFRRYYHLPRPFEGPPKAPPRAMGSSSSTPTPTPKSTTPKNTRLQRDHGPAVDRLGITPGPQEQGGEERRSEGALAPGEEEGKGTRAYRPPKHVLTCRCETCEATRRAPSP